MIFNSNEAQKRYSDLHRKMENFMQETDEMKKNPESKYDALIYKQNCVNDTVAAQVEVYYEVKILYPVFFYITPLTPSPLLTTKKFRLL